VGEEALLSTEVVALLESGCGLVVGTVSADGEPHVTRSWGLDVLDADAGRMRVLVEGHPVVLEHLETTGVLAVTGASVVTLRAVQVKARVETIEAATRADWERFRRHCEAFFHDVQVTDNIDRRSLERLLPDELVACQVLGTQVYDQTPGPGAGAPHR
jgi:hypothetical protein